MTDALLQDKSDGLDRWEHEVASAGRLFRSLTDNASVALIILDDRQRCVFMNPAAEALTGFAFRDARGRAAHDLVHHTRPDGSPYPIDECPIDRALPQNDREQGEEMFVHPGGRFYRVAFTASPLRDDDGTPIGTIVELTDITERARGEEALQESEERYRSLLENIDEGFCVLEMIEDEGGHAVDYRFLTGNPTFTRHTGLVDPIGRTARELVPDLEQEWVDVYAAVAATGEARRFELGSAVLGRTFEVEAARVGQPHQRRVALLFRDVTEQRRAAQALADAETRLRAALDAGAIGTFAFDVATDTCVIDERVALFYGLPADAAGSVPRSLVVAGIEPADRPLVDRRFAAALETCGRYEAEYRVRGRDGAVRWVQERGRAEPGQDGKPARLVAAVVDVSPLKEAEAELREREARLESALRAKDEFLGLVSHELRTPLTVILGMSSLLARGQARERVDEISVDIAEAAEALNSLVESMLLLARLDRGEAQLLREPVLLDRLVRDVVDRERRRHPDRSYEVRTEIRGAVVNIQASWLQRVLENLIGNATKYSESGSQILVILDEDESPGAVRVRVLDEGLGLAGGDPQALFDAFYRAPGAAERASGAGLGLAVAKRVIDLLEGRVWGRERATGGMEFGFALPVLDQEP